MRYAFFAFVLAASALPGCGSYTDSGVGSHTLLVVSDLVYGFNGNVTNVSIHITQNGNPLDNAAVAVKDADSDADAVIPEQNGNGQAGHYQSDWPGYHRRVELSVTSVSDYLHAKLEGPGTHRITAPPANGFVDLSKLGNNLTVKWTTDDGLRADSVEVRLHRGDFDNTYTHDNGSTAIPRGFLSVSDDNEVVTVTRTNQVVLAGGVPGSLMTLRYQVSNEVVVKE